MASPLGDLRCGHAGVEPGRHGRVPEAVRPRCKRGRRFLRRQRIGACLLPEATVHTVGDWTAILAAEDPAVWCGAELVQMPRRRATSWGTTGTKRTSSCARCLSCRRCRSPPSVHWGAVDGSDRLSANSPHPEAGRVTLDFARGRPARTGPRPTPPAPHPPARSCRQPAAPLPPIRSRRAGSPRSRAGVLWCSSHHHLCRD